MRYRRYICVPSWAGLYEVLVSLLGWALITLTKQTTLNELLNEGTNERTKVLTILMMMGEEKVEKTNSVNVINAMHAWSFMGKQSIDHMNIA